MVDPFSVTGLILQVGVTLKQLYDYGQQVASAKSDIQQLCLELSALKSLLEDFKDQDIVIRKHSTLLHALQGARTALNETLVSLAPSGSKAHRIKQSLTWPFKSDDVTGILNRLERAKTMLMLCLMGDLKSVRDDFAEVKDNVKVIMANQQHQKEEESRRKVIEMIAPVSTQFAHRTASALWRGTDSGSWLVDGPLKHFKDEPKCQLIAIMGISGAGKSTLMSRVIENLNSTSPANSVAYMYCMYNNAGTQEARNILGSWIAQLSPLKPDVLERFQAYSSALEPVPIDVVSGALLEIAESAGRIYLVLDALNECRAPATISSVLSDLVKKSTAISILVSTTTSDSAISRLCDERLGRTVVLTPENVHPDIERYIRHEIAEHPVLLRMSQDEIVNSVLTRANGMFRWAKCQMDLLAEQPTPKKVRQALNHLPATLHETYVVLLQRVSPHSREIVVEVLRWLCLSQRPLKLRELAEVVAFEVDADSIDDDCRIEPPESIIEMCHGLVLRDVATDTVSLAHGSIQTFLTSEFIRSSPVACYAVDPSVDLPLIACKCLSYLLLPQFGVGMCSKETFDKLQEGYPLLDYASGFWAVHAAAQTSLTPQQTALINRLFWTQRSEDGGGHFTFWVTCLIPETNRQVVSVAQPLYYAASFGLAEIVAAMLQGGMINLENEQGPWYIDHSCGRATSTALQVACWRGHLDVVSLLLKAGADPNSRNIVGATCLRCARRRGHSQIERLLIDAGADDEFQPQLGQLDLAPRAGKVDSQEVRACDIHVLAFRRILAETLGLDAPIERDDVDLVDLGVDSLLAIEIHMRFEETTGLELEPLFLLMNTRLRDIEDGIMAMSKQTRQPGQLKSRDDWRICDAASLLSDLHGSVDVSVSS